MLVVGSATRWVWEPGKAMVMGARGSRFKLAKYLGDRQLFRSPRPWNSEGLYTHPYKEGRRKHAPELPNTLLPSHGLQRAHTPVSLTCCRIFTPADTTASTSTLLTHI